MSFRPIVRSHHSATSLFSHPCDKFQLTIQLFLKLLTMASHLNPPNRQSHVCNFNQLIRDIRYAGLTRLLGVKVEIYQLSTLSTSSLRTSSPTSGGLWFLEARCRKLKVFLKITLQCGI